MRKIPSPQPSFLMLPKSREAEQTDQFTYINRNQQLKEYPYIDLYIQQIDLSGNLLKFIPSTIETYYLLKLILRDNILEELPFEIGNLQTLEHLDLSYNNLKRIPSSIGQLVQLTYLNLSSNLIDNLCSEISQLNLFFLGIANNCFVTIPNSFYKLINKLDQLELDWLLYCNKSYFLNEELKKQLIIIFQQESQQCSFENFYNFFTSQKFEYQFEKIYMNHSLGVLTLCLQQFKQLSIKHFLYMIQQPLTKENTHCINLVFNYLNKSECDQLCILFMLASRFSNKEILQMLSNYSINLHYQIKIDLICNNKLLILQGQTPLICLLQHNKNVTQYLQEQVKKGFDPQIKSQGENCLHICTRYNHVEGTKWALKYCQIDKQESLHKNTALHILFQRQHQLKIFYLLEDAKCNPFIQNLYNKIARHFQTQMIQLRYVKLFIKYEKSFIHNLIYNTNLNKNHEMIQAKTKSNFRDQSGSSLNTDDITAAGLSNLQDQIFIEILKILRTYQSPLQCIHKINYMLGITNDIKQKSIIQFILYLISFRIKYYYKLKSQSIISIVDQINQFKDFNHQLDLTTLHFHNTFINESILENKKQIDQQQYVFNKEKPELYQLQCLSQKLQYNLVNQINSQVFDKFYENNISSYINCYYLNHLSENENWTQQYQKQVPNNLHTLFQYEAFQRNISFLKLKYYKNSLDDYTMIIESPRQTLNEKMKFASQVNAKFKDMQKPSQSQHEI